MAYNLQSLINTLEQNLFHSDPQQFVLDHSTHTLLTSLLEKAVSLKTKLDEYPPAAIQRVNFLESQITDATHTAEDIIESRIVDQILLRPRGGKLTISPVDLQHVNDELDSITKGVLKIEDQASSSKNVAASDLPNPNEGSSAVGLDGDILQLKERLTGPRSNLEVIPIAGMGGIGKTTLARHLYNDSLISYHFDLCAWATVSQEYNVSAILISLVSCLTEVPQSNDPPVLGEVLYKTLRGKRYFVVLDDVWSTNVWNDIRMFFPNNKDGSRIVITTRNLDVADYANTLGSHHKMSLLNESLSWDLLCMKVFGSENCPSALELIGRRIAKGCRGLPLAIQVIGGILSKSPKTVHFWSYVANDVSSAMAGEDDQEFAKVLSLSYEHLPHHLRSCFLYLGGFQEDYEIKASRLIRLWVAEDFLQPIAERTLEEAAEMYLKALVDRNLLLVAKRKFDRKVKSYIIHDMLRDLCIRKAIEEKFLYVINKTNDVIIKDSSHQMRRMNSHLGPCRWFHPYELVPMPLVRSFVYDEYDETSNDRDKVFFSAFRLLRVLDITEFRFWCFPEQILQLVNIRHLAMSLYMDLPSSICKLRNLRSFILQGWFTTRLPFGIFGLPQIRHVLLKGLLPIKGHREDFLSENLQTLSGVVASVFSDNKFTNGIPNIRKLGVICSDFEVVDLSSLHKLETLKCSGWRGNHLSVTALILSCLTLSPSIKKLTLEYCQVKRSFLKYVGSLPNLQVLKLKSCHLVDDDMEQITTAVWEPTEGEFMSLEFLLLERLDLVHWRADGRHFPRLRHLVIRSCPKLENIPGDIGSIPTLEILELHNSSLAETSARLIQEEQCDMGNELEVRIYNPETNMSLERSLSIQSTESGNSSESLSHGPAESERNSGEPLSLEPAEYERNLGSLFHGSNAPERNTATGTSVSPQSAHGREGRARKCCMPCFRHSRVVD